MLAGKSFLSKVASAPDMSKLQPVSANLTRAQSNVSNGTEALSRRNSKASTKGAAADYGTVIDKGGKGGTSRVFFSLLKGKDGVEKMFAVKSYNSKAATETEERWKRHLLAEHEILVQLRHHNVVETFDLLSDSKGSLFEVLEFCEGGDLMTLLNEKKGLLARESDCLFYQLMTGIAYLHDVGVAHRDLKAENLVMTKKGTLKIADFGNAEHFRSRDGDAELVEGKCGSDGFMAPELFNEKEFHAAPTDVWSAGIIYFLMRFYGSLWGNAEMIDPAYARYVEARKTAEGFEALELLKYERLGGRDTVTEEAVCHPYLSFLSASVLILV